MHLGWKERILNLEKETAVKRRELEILKGVKLVGCPMCDSTVNLVYDGDCYEIECDNCNLTGGHLEMTTMCEDYESYLKDLIKLQQYVDRWNFKMSKANVE